MLDYLNDGVTWPEVAVTLLLLGFAAFVVLVIAVLFTKMMDME